MSPTDPTRARRPAAQPSCSDRLVALFLAEGFSPSGSATSRPGCAARAPRSTWWPTPRSRSCWRPSAATSAGPRERIEARVEAEPDPAARLRTYLLAVADELAPVSARFYADLAAYPPAGEVYEENTRLAARRVRDLVDEGVAAGALRPVDADFVGAAVAEVMTGIQAGRVGAASGLSDAEAYRALADVVVGGLVRDRD